MKQQGTQSRTQNSGLRNQESEIRIQELAQILNIES